jgi:hypothetical protein
MPDIIPKSKPKYTRILDMLNTKAAANQFTTQTYTDLVLDISKKAYNNNELSKEEYNNIIKPLKGDTGIMVLKQIQKEKEYLENLEKYAVGGRVGLKDGSHDVDYWAMVGRMFIEAGADDATGMNITEFAAEYFPR